MKKISACFLVVFVLFGTSFIGNRLFAQQSVTWIGIDYSQTKFVGMAGFPNPAELPAHIQGWNDFVITESAKYNLKAAFGQPSLVVDLKKTNAANKTLNPADQIQEDDFRLTEEQVMEVIRGYELSDLSGTVLLMVAECYNKKRDIGSYWLAEVNAESGEILSTRRLEAKTGGFGIKNYWARTFYNILLDLQKEQQRKR